METGGEHIGHRLRALRKERKESQVIVSVALGISRSHLANIERGHDDPGWSVVVAAAAYFEVSLDWLASGPGEIRIGAARAANEKEALLLYGYRELPEDVAEGILKLILGNARPTQNS